jgi:hypothetical protein
VKAVRGPVVAAVVALSAAMVAVPHGGAQERSTFVHHRFVFAATPQGASQRILVTWPRRPNLPDGFVRGERQSVLVALHGAREAELSASAATLSWHRDYALDDAMGALFRGNLTEAHYHQRVQRAHLDATNAALAASPFRGMIVATPYTPPFTNEAFGSDAVEQWGDWIAGPVLEAVRRELPAAHLRSGAAIHGVSLGGRLALEIGFRHPEAFGAVGALQPAIQESMVEPLATLAASASTNAETRQRIEIVTSDADGGRETAFALGAALRSRRVPHDVLQAVGEHGYEFNRGPGAIEMLRFADRALAAERDTN